MPNIQPSNASTPAEPIAALHEGSSDHSPKRETICGHHDLCQARVDDLCLADRALLENLRAANRFGWLCSKSRLRLFGQGRFGYRRGTVAKM